MPQPETDRREAYARIIGRDAFTAAAEISSWLDERGLTGWEKLGVMLLADMLWKVQDSYDKADEVLALAHDYKAGLGGEPVACEVKAWAWMKRWTDPKDGPGPNRVRVDMNDTVKPWMQDCTVTPLGEISAIATQSAPATAGVAITEEMVERAARQISIRQTASSQPSAFHLAVARAALTAALSGTAALAKAGEDR